MSTALETPRGAGDTRNVAGPQRGPDRPLEYVLAATALTAIVVLHVIVQQGGVLFTRALWLDEVHTLLVADAGSPVEILRRLRAGADYNPPAYYTLIWIVGLLPWGLDEVVLRVASLAAVGAAAGFVYAVLRSSFARLPAFTGALLVVSHPIVLQQAFDARMYGLLLLASTMFVYTIHVVGEDFRRKDLLVGASAVLLCLTHYYGILVWLLVLAAAALRHGAHAVMRRYGAAVAGPVALLACIPLYLGQSAAISGRTWVHPLSARQVLGMVRELAPPFVTIAILGLFVATAIVLRKRTDGSARALLRSPAVALLALGLLPLLLMAVSVIVQPTMITRYAFPAVLAAAPLVALAVARMGRPLGAGAVLILLLTGLLSVRDLADDARLYQAGVERDATTLRAYADRDIPIVAVSRLFHYRTVMGHTQLEQDVALVILPDSLITAADLSEPPDAAGRAMMQVERDVGLVHQELFGVPRTVAFDSLRMKRTFVLAGASRSEVTSFVRNWLPNHTLRPISLRIYLASRAGADEPDADR